MNVLFVTGIFPPDRGGPASYVPAMAGALTRRGHRVEVLCLSDQPQPSDTARPFRVQRLRRGMFWPARVVATAAAVWRAALRHDLVYVNGLGAEAALGALLAGRPAVHKIVGDYAWERAVGRRMFTGTIDEYQAHPKSLALRLLDAIRTVPLLLARAIIVPSRYLQRIVTGWGIAERKVGVVYNAVEFAEAPRDEAPPAIPPWSGRTLVTACRLVRWKGVDALILLLAELPDTRLVVAGDGHLRRELEETARRTGVAERVIFLGDVPHRHIAGVFRQADAFVLNSTYEGLPHVVLEAMGAGLPVIATDAGGTGEVVVHEETGLLVPVGKADALRAAIRRLWDDPAFARRLVSEASRRLDALFAFETMVARTEATLLTAAAAPGRSAREAP